MEKKVGVLLSGGLDSCALAGHYLRRGFEVTPIYVEGGLRWEGVERYWLGRYLKALKGPRLKPLKTLKLDQRDLIPQGHWAKGGRVPGLRAAWDSVYLPGRNLLLLSKGGVLCAGAGLPRLALAVVAGNPFGDAKTAFFRGVERVLRLALGRAVKIEAPFVRLRKKEIIRRSAGLPLELSFSCIHPKGRRHCGRCTKCFERRQAFRRAGVSDPTAYAA